MCAEASFERVLVFGSDSAAEIRGLRISPLAVVLKPKFCIVHDLTFARASEGTSMNNDTMFSSAPTRMLGSVLRDMPMRVLLVRRGYERSDSFVSGRRQIRISVGSGGPCRRPSLSMWPAITWLWIFVCCSGGVTAREFGVWLRRRSNILTLVPRLNLL